MRHAVDYRRTYKRRSAAGPLQSSLSPLMCRLYPSNMSWVVRWLLLSLLISAVYTAPSQTPSSTDYKEMGVQYDEYPVVVPKRAAMLLDRIMVALQKAVDEENTREVKPHRIPIEETMDLQRRGQQKGGRIYWRCYFNAVTCF